MLNNKNIKWFSIAGKKETVKVRNMAYSWQSETCINKLENEITDDTSLGGGKDHVGSFLLNLYRSQKFTDVTLVMGQDDSIKAHRVVLAAKSPYFEERLFGSKRRGFWQKDSLEMRMILKTIDLDAFRSILEYLYTDEIDFQDEASVFEIYTGAREYQIQSLVEICETKITRLELTADNVCPLYQTSDAAGVEQFRDKCIEYIQHNTEEILSSNDFEKYPYSTIHMICNLKHLSLKHESTLVEAVAKWINSQSPHIQKQLTTPLLACIRFLTFSVREFSQCMQRFPNLVPADDALKIMMILTGSGVQEDLPTWCSRNVDLRCKELKNLPPPGPTRTIRGKKVKRFMFPLNQSPEITEKDELTCQIMLTCKHGFHTIRTLNFVRANTPDMNDSKLRFNLSLILHPNTYRIKRMLTCEKNEHKFLFRILVHEDNILVINLKIENLAKSRLFKIDTRNVVDNQDFQCSVITEDNLFCFSAIEYT